MTEVWPEYAVFIGKSGMREEEVKNEASVDDASVNMHEQLGGGSPTIVWRGQPFSNF